ncbi:hypothetical protein F9Y90_05130 (plasmid) [Borrelia miyamotoi]|uniref:Lipoprotein n=1 Tax=Borrelia miyamotoi TaxID=47466 RepID=A0A5P8AR96_9SPIR|nr:hypothetical protein [Borrelia miyamotoi]QFP42487.1 hypothetical protein F9Y90_05130 [Borrelia miyamotoi]WAZ72264.1 hypothetical protein O5404_04335 [Borrelia miyamotoi]WAZ72497.1 hypothetical protein O5404_05640 [Borrelia miyamotoi]WVI05256.1 hypothetical protein F9Y91_00040 [Borrelia miyamotoi]WVI05421.1 hypothetical protein F9Y91_00950 [Borrelia miyamotoi]
MFKTLILTLIFSILSCNLISEKNSHNILLKLEKELINYNMKAKQKQMTLEKEKKAFVESNTNNSSSPIPVLNTEVQAYLNEQISKSKKLEKKCEEIIKITSEAIKEMEALYNKALKMEKKANEIKTMSDKARANKDNLNWSTNKKIQVDTLSKQAQNKISPTKYWTEKTKRIYQSLKGSIETAMSVLNYTHQLGEEIKTGQLPENWTIRIVENNQSSNDIIKKCEETLKEYDDKKNAKTFVKELEKDVQEALRIIESNI